MYEQNDLFNSPIYRPFLKYADTATTPAAAAPAAVPAAAAAAPAAPAELPDPTAAEGVKPDDYPIERSTSPVIPIQNVFGNTMSGIGKGGLLGLLLGGLAGAGAGGVKHLLSSKEERARNSLLKLLGKYSLMGATGGGLVGGTIGGYVGNKRSKLINKHRDLLNKGLSYGTLAYDALNSIDESKLQSLIADLLREGVNNGVMKAKAPDSAAGASPTSSADNTRSEAAV